MRDWKKVLGWTATIFGAALLFAIVAGVLLLKNSGFQHYLVGKIEQQANEATGGRVEIQNFIFHLKTLTADVYGLTIHGTEAPEEKPLLQIPHVRVGLKILSIFDRKVNLSELLIESPAVNLVVNKEGRSNLPEPPPRKSRSSTNVFDLAVGHVLLTHGAITLKDRKIPVDANLLVCGRRLPSANLQRNIAEPSRIRMAAFNTSSSSLCHTVSRLSLMPLHPSSTSSRSS